MKNLIYLLFAFLILSCNTKVFKKSSQSINAKKDHKLKKKSNQQDTDCAKYWASKFPKDSLKIKLIERLISQKEFTKNNLKFLKALKNQNQKNLAFKNVLSPIFRLSESEIGIFTFPKYKHVNNKLIPVSKEMNLIEKFDTINENTMEHFGEIKFYPILLNSVFYKTAKPTINYYTTTKVGESSIIDLGIYVDECLKYYEYSIDTVNISKNDNVLFSSPYKIDLVFETNRKIDSLIKTSYKKECIDCPNSSELQKTFARVKGTTNLYFIYADTFPINNEINTPSRALILITEKDEIIYLWYSEIDLFGCSCL